MKISKKLLINLFLLIPFFKLPGFSEYRVISSLFDMWFVLSCVCIVLKVACYRYRPSVVTTIVIVREAYMFLLTVYKGGFSTPLIRNTLGAAIVCLLVDYQLNKNAKSMCRTIALMFTIYTVLNLLAGNGMVFNTYLFGQRTNFTIISFPMMLIMVIFVAAYTKGQDRRRFQRYASLVILINSFFILKESVSTAILGMVIFLVLYAVFYRIKFDKIPATVYVIILVIYNFAIVFLQNFDYMKFIFENLLGESMTMTGRLVIWNNAILTFLQKPLFGYGYAMANVSRGQYATSTSYVHNDFLQHCVEGGIVDLALFVLILVFAVRFFKKYSSSKLKCAMLAGILGLEITMGSEVPSSLNYFFVLMVLSEYFSWHGDHIDKYIEKGDQKCQIE